MVEKMLKYSFLVYHKEYDEFLEQLRTLGVLHIIAKANGVPAEGSELQQMMARVTRIKQISNVLVGKIADREKVLANDTLDADGMINQYDDLLEQLNKCIHQQAALKKEIERISVWGDFDPTLITQLHREGYALRLYCSTLRNFRPEWAQDYNALTMAVEGSTLYFATLTPVLCVVELEGADQVRLPESSLSELIQELAHATRSIDQAQEAITSFGIQYYESLQAASIELRNRCQYATARLNTEAHSEDTVMLLEGWAPVKRRKELNAFLEENQSYYQVQEPTVEDNVPVLLRNNAFARLFEPIGALYDLPNYHELDLTVFFAPFYVMFFGLCLGDAGYGLLIALLGVVGLFTLKPSLKPYARLATLLGVGTIFFGFISGTFFGIPLLDVSWPWIQSLKKMMLRQDQLFYLSLILGVVQILFAMVVKAIAESVRFGFAHALSTWGWLLLFFGCGGTYFATQEGWIDVSLTTPLYYGIAGVAAIAIFLLNNFKRNPIINIGAGLWGTYNMATGLLGDILSYVRLFALGVSGSILGLVFNDLAMSMSGGMPIILRQLVLVLMLLFGHGLNIFLCTLGAFVHPLRLTFVEFYKNVGFEGGGKQYTPFQKIKK